MSQSYLSSAMNFVSNTAHAVAPSMFEAKTAEISSPSMRGKMIPNAPPQPSSEDLNKHYLARDRTVENASAVLSSAVNYVGEVATDLKAALPSAEQLKTAIPAAIGLGPQLDANGIPIPPPLPSREVMHKHYLVPLAPALPTREAMHKHYLIPLAPPLPTREMMNRHYLSRDKTLENASNILRSAASVMSNFAADMTARLPSAADLGLATKLDARGIPVPPAQPTREMMHKHFLIPAAPPMPVREDFHGHYLIPMAPPLPTKEMMNRHYLARDKTVENVQLLAKSYVNYASEVASDLKQAVVSAPILSTTRSIPAPPPMPTRETMHKHYLTRPAFKSNKAYPADMSQNEREIVEKLYAPREELVEPEVAAASPMFSFSKVKRMANNAASNILSKFSTPVEPLSSQEHIPIPPALPTREMMHKHYLIPLAPALPTKEAMHRHYLSRNKTIENAGSLLSHVATFVTEVATEVKDYVMETPISAMPADIKEVLNPTPVDSEGIPIPPALPTREMLHKHYLIPMAPALPARDAMHRHYLSRDRSIENAGQAIRSAVNLASEVVVDAKDAVVDSAIAAKDAVVDGVSAIPAAAEQAGNIASEKIHNAGESLSNAAVATKDVVVDGAVQLKQKVLPAAIMSPRGMKYSRAEVISESPILKKKTAGARRIVARKDYNGFKPLIQSIPQRI